MLKFDYRDETKSWDYHQSENYMLFFAPLKNEISFEITPESEKDSSTELIAR